MSPGTVALYVGQATAFVEYLKDTPPQHSRLKAQDLVVLYRYLQKMYRDLNRTILGHQVAVKAKKQQQLVSRESLGTCICLARQKIPSLLGNSRLNTHNPNFTNS